MLVEREVGKEFEKVKDLLLITFQVMDVCNNNIDCKGFNPKVCQISKALQLCLILMPWMCTFVVYTENQLNGCLFTFYSFLS